MKLYAVLFFAMLISRAFCQEDHSILARAELNKKLGCIDTLGNAVIPIIYDDMGFWGSNLLPVNRGAKGDDFLKAGGKWGYCNNRGVLVIPLQYSRAETFHEGLAAVKVGLKWGFIDTTGQMTITPRFDEARIFSEGRCAVAIDGKWGFIDNKGEELIPITYGEAADFKDHVAAVFVGEKQHEHEDWEEATGGYCLIDNRGKQLTDTVYTMIWHFTEGLAKVEVKDSADRFATKKGSINLKGETIVPPVYDIAEDFSEGFAAVGFREKDTAAGFAFAYDYTLGYVNARGEEIIAPQYQQAEKFVHGRAVVSKDRPRGMGAFTIDTRNNAILNPEDWPKYALIDTAGNYLLDFEWRSLVPIDSNRYVASRARFAGDGVIDVTGKTLVPFEYTNLHYLGNNLFAANDGGGNSGELQLLTIDHSLLFKTNKFAMPSPEYTYGMLPVRTHRLSKSGFVDTKGNWIIKDRYDMVWEFESTRPAN